MTFGAFSANNSTRSWLL